MGAVVGFAAFAVWLIFLTVTIAVQPPSGAPTPQALAAETVQALTSEDSEGLEALIAPGALGVDDDYVEAVFEQIAGAGALTGRIDEAAGAEIVVVTPAGGQGCLSWAVDTVDDRYVLDVVPPLAAC